MRAVKLYAPALVLAAWAIVVGILGEDGQAVAITALLTLAFSVVVQVREAARLHHWRRNGTRQDD